MEQWYCHIWCKAFKIQPPSPLWRMETVPIPFSVCHIANEKAAIIDIASGINHKWREKSHNKTISLEGGLEIQPVEDKLMLTYYILVEEYLINVCNACKSWQHVQTGAFSSPSLVSIIRFPPPGSWRYYEQWLAGVIIDINHHLPEHIRTMCIIKPPAKVKIMKSLRSFPSKWQD